MQTALQNPRYKKIWKEINWDLRNPQAETLEEALLEEACYDDCLFIEKNYKISGIPRFHPRRLWTFIAIFHGKQDLIAFREIAHDDILERIGMKKDI